jgi:tetratricopeptide (TPR) repeat protein
MDNALLADGSLQPLYITLLTRLALHFREQDDFVMTETLYRHLTTYKPEDVPYQICLAEVLTVQKKYEEARDVYNEILQRAPDNAQAKLRYGMLATLLGDYEHGLAAMDAALAASPELSEEMAGGLLDAWKRIVENPKNIIWKWRLKGWNRINKSGEYHHVIHHSLCIVCVCCFWACRQFATKRPIFRRQARKHCQYGVASTCRKSLFWSGPPRAHSMKRIFA